MNPAPLKPRTIWGYATTSHRSAIVMKLVDALPSVRKTQTPPLLTSDTVISSVAGLGDLVIQMPLIDAMVSSARRNGADPLVALRPAHVSLGVACGWRVLAFENPLTHFFGHGISIRVACDSLDAISRLRKRRVHSWIDLTGNAVNALALRIAGVREVSSIITRGGSSSIHCGIPHRPFENEYEFRARLADYFGCALDFSVYQRLAVSSPSGPIVLAITTYNRWKSWPLTNFHKIAQAFPEKSFVAVGSLKEIPAHDLADWVLLRSLPNVSNQLDALDLPQLASTIASACAFIGNDSGGTHFANAYEKKGAVIFGPTMSDTWHNPRSRLKLFHDQSCPYYPCKVWKCDRPEQWCMTSTSAEMVIQHLRTILA